MKKILFFILVLFSSYSLAQDTPGNLQFNRIVNFSDVYVEGQSDIRTFTVPDGKVWKITNFTMIKLAREICFCAAFIKDQDSNEQYGINAFISNGEQTNTEEGNLNSLTIWLNSGTKDIKFSVQNMGSYNVSYSAIEFNIVDN